MFIPEENETRVEALDTQENDTTTDYISAINELKKNTVSKEKYDSLLDENKKLIQNLVNGQTVVEEESKPNLKELRDNISVLRGELFNSENQFNNVEYIDRALKLRENLIEVGEPDPFIPVGKQISPTNEDIERASIVAQVYKECLEYAQGDNEAFTNELMRRTKDVKIPRR